MWFLGLLVPVVGFVWAYRRLQQRVLRHRPANYPGHVAKRPGAIVVVCAGDSLTHGNVSANYVDLLLERLPPTTYQVFNAGINADLTVTLLGRLNDVVALQPDVVTLLIGTNDVNATLGPAMLDSFRRRGKIAPDTLPSFTTFRQHYRALIHRLRSETRARIAVMSLPPMGEALSSHENQLAEQYSAFIRQLAADENVTYLPVRERMTAHLRAQNRPPRYGYDRMPRLLASSVVRHHLLGQSWDAICQRHGNVLLHDNLHLNTAGAAIIADAIAAFLAEQASIRTYSPTNP